jgi:molecular chaperone GrpE
LLEISDELELALKTARDMGNSEALVQGVEMTLKKLYKVMDREGVSPITCNLSAFDPSKHEAVEKVERDDLDNGIIVEEIRKGYMMKDKVIRPSIVKVAIKPSKLKDKGEKSHEQ